MSDTVVEVHPCHATTAAGNPCKAEAAKGHDYCPSHIRQQRAKQAAEAVVPDQVFLAPPSNPDFIPTLPYPFNDGNVNENAAIRMVAMVHPDCPIESTPEIRTAGGTYVANPKYTGEQNCQQVYKLNEQGRWDVQKCIDNGHEPYYTVFRRSVSEDVFGPDGYLLETKQRPMREKRLNVIQVSDNNRHTNRTEVALSLARGSLLLADFVCTCSKGEERPHKHEVPCEFRNCSRPQTIDTQYGRYCSERHARLVGADFRRMILPVGGDAYTEDQANEEREQMLSTLSLQAKPVG